MRRITFFIVTALAIASCGGEVGSDSTTSIPTTTTSSTTTTLGTTTTSTVPTTEESTTTTTTTTTLPPGNWAAEALVVSEYGALGYWDGSSWIQASEFTPLPVSGGEDYQVVLLGINSIISGGPETVLCEPLNNPGVELSNASILRQPFPAPSGIAISAPWNLVPHFVQEETDDGTYSAFARPLLAARGLEVANPVIKQVIRFDMDGDGTNEVIAVAEEVTGDGGIYAEEGNYSLVFMRFVVDGEVQTAILGESIVDELGEFETPFILTHSVAAIADLSGDGKMEFVINEVYYEGVGWSVWEYVNDDLGPVRQIGSGCGV
jgi:hypothetical protein